MLNPLVSIVIPVYNGSNYLKDAIDSALAQTYKNIEVLVINDGSKDDGATEAVALSYGDKIRYFSKENGGVSSALNVGIENMKGEYFSWLSHDDMYTPEKIESQVKLMNDSNKDCIFCCASSFIDGKGEHLDRHSRESSRRQGQYSGAEILSSMFSGVGIGGCALLIPRFLFERFGRFREDIRYMQDYDMWYRLFINGVRFVYDGTHGVLSRVHAQQATVTAKHLGSKDADIVGQYMVENLEGIYNGSENLLKKYMFLCFRNRSLKTGKLAYKTLSSRKELSFSDRLKANYLKFYGKLRPYLVRIYYKIFFRIKVKK